MIVFVPPVHHLATGSEADDKFRVAYGHHVFSCHPQDDVLPDSKPEKSDTLTYGISSSQWCVHGLGSSEDPLLLLHLDIVGQHCMMYKVSLDL